MATNYAKFEYDLIQAESLDDYFNNLDAGQNLLPIGGIQLDDLPAVKIGTTEAKEVREILRDLPLMLRNIKNSYLTVDLMPSGIAYDNTSLNNVLLIKLDIVNWFNLLYNTAKREDLVTSMANLATARDKTAELNEKLTNYENKTTNDALRDADEQLDNADKAESNSEVLDKLEHDNLVDAHGEERPKEDEQANDGNASNSNQDSASNSDQDSASHGTPSDDNKPTSDNNAENQANNENDENSQDDTANSDTKNPDDSNESDDLSTNSNDLPTLDDVTESDDENQDNSQNTDSTNNADGTDDLPNSVENNTDDDNASSELDDLENESLPHNVTNRTLSADAQTEMAKQDDKLQQVKTAAENAKANINPESQADVPSVKMQTPPVQVTNSTGQDTQTQLLTKMMETLNLVLKRETQKDKDTQAPKAFSELTPNERLAKFRSEQDQLIASMIAKQI